jgi:putative addiction module CopG family antidote
MTVHLKPELEAMIQADVERGLYPSVDEFVERAVKNLHEQEEWLAHDRDVIAEQIEHGFAQAERGELVDGDGLPKLLRARRAARQNRD